MADRPESSDELPTGAWLKELQDDGYRPYTWSGRAGWLSVALGAVVVVATVLAAWLLWDRIPEQVPLHTGADGQVSRWGEKTVTNVLSAPLMGGGGLLLAMLVVLGVGTMSRPRAATARFDGGHALGSLVRQAATTTAVVRATSWGCLGILAAIAALELPRWIWGYDTPSPVWLLGLAIMAFVVLQWIFARQLRPMVERELAALEVPVGPQTDDELTAWRYCVVVDDPKAPVWVRSATAGTNYTVNIAHPAGKFLALGFVVLLLGIAVFLVLMPLLFG